MAFQMSRIQVWSAEVSDRPGEAAAKLEILFRAGANLAFVFTRPKPGQPEQNLLFLGPIVDAAHVQAAQAAGLTPARDVAMLCVEGENRAGIAFQLMSHLAVAGIFLRGLSINAIDQRFAAYLAFDNPDILNLAVRTLAALVD